jgi:hypothetical protein
LMKTVRRVMALLVIWLSQNGLGETTVGQATYLDAKAEGDNSMSSKRGPSEGVYGKFAPQDPHDMVRARLPESQFPAAQVVTPRSPRLEAGPPLTDNTKQCRDIPDLVSWPGHSPNGGRWTTSPFKGTNGTPTSCYYSQQQSTTGLPTGREPYGNGVPVVVVGVTTDQGGRESRPQGEGGQVSLTTGWNGARDA